MMNWVLDYRLLNYRSFFLELRSEIEKLKGETGHEFEHGDMISQSLAEISTLKSKLRNREQEMAQMTR